MDVFLDCVDVWTPVTALHVCDDYLCVGVTNKLEVYHIPCPSVPIFYKWLKCTNIHGITSQVSTSGILIAAFGHRFLSIIMLRFEENQFRWDFICQEEYLSNWIKSARFIDDTLACITSYNELVFYDILSKKFLKTLACPVKCLLYSSLIIKSPSVDDLLIASGTVFKEIILWSYSQKKIQVISTLTGHQGVIFALEYDSKNHRLFSASDDRSIRIWFHEYSKDGPAGWETSKFYLLQVMYGHEARIWSLLYVDSVNINCLVSCGENNNLCIWDPDTGKLAWKNSSNQNSILSMTASSKRLVLYAGSSDGSIRVISLNEQLFSSKKNTFNCSNSYPKFIAIHPVDEELIIYITNDASLMLLKNTATDLVIEKSIELGKDYLSYCVATCDKQQIYCCSQNGRLKVFSVWLEKEKEKEYEIFAGKIFSCFFVSESNLLIGGPNGMVKILSGEDIIKELKLPNLKHPWPTCGLVLDNMMILGDRSGQIHVYGEGSEAVQVISNAHSSNGVNDLKQNPYSPSFLYSCGREGKVCEYKWHGLEHRLELLRILPINIGFDWFDRIVFDQEYQEMYLAGFFSSNFIIWRKRDQCIMWNVECGGGHRLWNFSMLPNSIRFCYVKQNKLFSCSNDINQLVKFAPLIRPKFHSTKINCSTIIKSKGTKTLFATGGEDSIIISEYDHIQKKIFFKQTLSGHISSIRTLCSIEDEEIVFLISGGGRSQLIVSLIQQDSDGNLLTKQLDSHFHWSNKPPKHWKDFRAQTDSQVRYLASEILRHPEGLLIAMSCSDGFLRFFLYDLKLQTVKFISERKVSIFCPLSLTRINNTYLVGANDGVIGCWRFQSSEQTSLTSVPTSQFQNLIKVGEIYSHQSGINCIRTKHLRDDLSIVFSSGDDGNLTAFIIKDGLNFELLAQTSVNSAHTALISSLALYEPNIIVSASLDERLRCWAYRIKDFEGSCRECTLELKTSTVLRVSDVSSSVPIYSTKENSLILLAGQGFQIFNIHQ